MTTFKSFLIGFMILFMMLSLEGCWFVGSLGKRLDKESKEYVDQAVPEIVGNWHLQELMNRASAEFVEVSSRSDMEKLFFVFQRLGAMQEYKGSEGEASFSASIPQGIIITAAYVAKAEFENGPAIVTVRLVRRGGEWKVAAFQVNSDVFYRANPSTQASQNLKSEERDLTKSGLEEHVRELLEGDQVSLRKDIDTVFSLAALYEEEGNDTQAIQLYKKALEVNAGNLEYQLRLAKLLHKQGDTTSAVSKAQLIYDMSENEGLMKEAVSLLSAMGKKAATDSSKASVIDNVEIVLVPLGRPSQILLTELKDALEEKMGIKFYLSDKIMDLGQPDRTWAKRYVTNAYKRLKETLTQLQIDSLVSDLNLNVEDLSSEENQVKFIRAALGRMGLDGEQERAIFDANLQTAREHSQYDTSRLLWELRKAHLMDVKIPIKGYLAITNEDIYEGDDNFRLGAALPGYAVVSYHRFTAGFNEEDQNRPRLLKRTLKQAVSSANHVLGMPRCSNPACVRAYPHSVAEHDAKSDDFCQECRERLEAYKEGMVKNPKAGMKHAEKAYSLSKSGKLDMAIAEYRKAITHSPNMYTAYFNLGLTLQGKGMLAEAITQFETAAAIQPAFFEAYRSLGIAYGMQGSMDESITAFKNALILRPDDAQTHNDLGYSYYKKKMYQEAIEQINKALVINPDIPLVHYNLALAYYANQQPQLALIHCDKSVLLGYKADPRFVNALKPYRRGAATPVSE